MKVDTQNKNKALESLFADPAQIVFLDANFFIPPDRSELMDRSRIKVKAISFPKFCEIWLDPIFEEFPNLAMNHFGQKAANCGIVCYRAWESTEQEQFLKF